MLYSEKPQIVSHTIVFLIIAIECPAIVSFVMMTMVMMMRTFFLVIVAEGEGLAEGVDEGESVAKGVDEGVDKNHGKAIKLSLIALLRPLQQYLQLRGRLQIL